MDEIEVEILETGEIRFARGTPEQNERLLALLQEISADIDKQGIKEFLDGSKSIERVFGDTNFCG